MAGPLASPAAIQRIAQASEGLGFDSVWLHDFIIWNEHLDRVHISCGSAEAVEQAGDYPPMFFESLSTLAFVAGVTSRVRLGIAVLCVPFRNPIITAKQIATIDTLSGGRMILGIGTGAAKSVGNLDFEVLGVSRANKYGVTRDYVGAMQAVWEGASAYSGPFVQFEEATIYPLPAQRPHPPLWLGGAGPKALAMAGEFGDGWIPGRVSVEEYPRRIAEIHEHAARSGRTLNGFTVASEIYACIGETDAVARSKAERTIETVVSRGGFGTVAAQESFASHALIGNADTLAEKVASYARAGVEHFELKFIYQSVDDLIEQLEIFSSGVAEPVRRALTPSGER